MADPPGTPDDQRRTRGFLVGTALTTNLTDVEALLAGLPIPRSRLNGDTLLRLGEPLHGPDYHIDPDRIDELYLRLETTKTNGSSADHPEPPPGLTAQTLHDFANVDEASADPILGGETTCLLSHGGMLVLYGDGGAGKTTLELDLVCHLASGTTWQNQPVHGTPRILIIENEGPRGMFRKKARAKLAAWQGAEIDTDRVYVLEDPWAVFSFADENYRDHLAALIATYQIDIVAAGPVNSLGIQGGGTPEEVAAFKLCIELIRQKLPRPLAVILAHHENKSGDVSGAWEGVPDTLAHVRNDGNGHTTVRWQKVRWGPDLHGKTWKLLWRPGETFELEEKAELTDDEVADAMTAYIADHPGTKWRPVREALGIQAERAGDIRDKLLSDGVLHNDGAANSMSLYLRTRPGPDDDIPL